MISKCISILCVVLLLTLSACGGSSPTSTSTPAAGVVMTGVFVDNVAENIKYVSSSKLTGRTDAKGTYQYRQGDVVSFYVGDVKLGALQGKSIVSVLDLKDGVQAAILLQSLDTDQIPSNGIQISNADFAALQGKNVQLNALNPNDPQSVASFEQAAGITRHLS